MKKVNKKGFTIVELVIVIAVIAILAAVLIPTFTNVGNKAKESAAMQAARNEFTEYLSANAEKISGTEVFVITVNENSSNGTTYYFSATGASFDATIKQNSIKTTNYKEVMYNYSTRNNDVKIYTTNNDLASNV